MKIGPERSGKPSSTGSGRATVPGFCAAVLWPGPSYLESRKALRAHMPELVPVWEQLVELAGGGDVESRFLSLWCPPPYIAGCSQAVWIDASGHDAPALIRNYDFAPGLLEGTWLATRWNGQRVAALGDCIWGALDGMNEAGLAASLSFGGRTVSGDGFGIPLVVRYVLEVAQTTAEAVKLLQRVPVSMCYTVTLLDRHGDWATVFVSPDRTTEVTRRQAVTNFQHQVEWPKHAQATNAEQRLESLQRQIDAQGTLEEAIGHLLRPPHVPGGVPAGLWNALHGRVPAAPGTHRAVMAWPALGANPGRICTGLAPCVVHRSGRG